MCYKSKKILVSFKNDSTKILSNYVVYKTIRFKKNEWQYFWEVQILYFVNFLSNFEPHQSLDSNQNQKRLNDAWILNEMPSTFIMLLYTQFLFILDSTKTFYLMLNHFCFIQKILADIQWKWKLKYPVNGMWVTSKKKCIGQIGIELYFNSYRTLSKARTSHEKFIRK